MGTFSYPITVRNPETGASVSVDALVDTGATFSIVPEVVLRGIGIGPSRDVEMELADHSIVQVQLGNAEIVVDGEATVGPCLFGQEGWPTLLGAVTMESLLLAPDPVHRRFTRVTGWLASGG
jgi:clan AA aspartic protease